MDNDKTTPVLLAGTLPKSCYADANEFASDLVKQLRIPSDTYSVIQGAKGEIGKRGGPGGAGPKGDKGEKGDSEATLKVIAIPMGSTYVDFPWFALYKKASYHIHHKGRINSIAVGVPAYNPAASGIVAIGTIIEMAPGSTIVRVFFLFSGIVTVPDSDHVLHISYSNPIA